MHGYSLLCQRYIMQSKPRSSPHSLFPLGCCASSPLTTRAIIKKLKGEIQTSFGSIGYAFGGGVCIVKQRYYRSCGHEGPATIRILS